MEVTDMFKNYIYEKPAFIGEKTTDALTAAFAGGAWLHIDDANERRNNLYAPDSRTNHQAIGTSP